MQQPTCTGLRVRTPADAHVIFHAVSLRLLPMVSRRLDAEERRSISPGYVFVWEERGPDAEATGLGIERWTDSIRWGPSRVRDEFLFYHEKDTAPLERESISESDTTPPSRPLRSHRGCLIKQTYSVFVDTSRGRRKWHLIAYFTQDSLDYLETIDDRPQLSGLSVPVGKYRSARSAKTSRHHHDLIVVPPFGCSSRSPKHQYTYLLQENEQTKPATFRSTHFNCRQSPPSTVPRGSDALAPLEYLQSIPPVRRFPADEEVLMSFASRSRWTV